MNKLEKRAFVCFALIIFLLVGTGYFVYKLYNDGGKWVSYPANSHIYEDGNMTKGTIYDRNGIILYNNTEDGIPEFNESYSMRSANLHVVGDAEGNISTGANRVFASLLVGYSFLNGVYDSGNDEGEIHLTVDAYANLYAYEALGDRDGAVMVYNYETGEILVSISSPGFDPEEPYNIQDGAYINKGFSSSIVPGSIFKVVTTVAAIETIENIEEFEHVCTGSLEFDGDIINCEYAHGTVNLEDALVSSCNGAYAILSTEIGRENLEKYTEDANLTKSYDIDGIITEKGTFEFPENKYNMAWAAIGQHHDLLNPLSMMVYLGAIANGGKAIHPSILLSSDSEGSVLNKKKEERLINTETAVEVEKMLRETGLSYEEEFPGLEIYCKTGSAGVNEGELANSWFTGYIKNENHPYAFICVIERGGTGSRQVINQVLQYLVEN